MKVTFKKPEKNHQPNFRFWAICTFFLLLGFWVGFKNIPSFLKANLELLSKVNITEILFVENNFDTLHLEISFKNLRKIEDKRKEALLNGLLVSGENDFVNARISHRKKYSKCKVRLKGDLPDHWAGEKISLRVELKDNLLVKGMSRFSLQDPLTRFNTAEWLFLTSLRRENCMSVRYDFINLIINGEKLGIYAIEEHFSKEMIESNRRREGVIVKFDDKLLWKKSPKDLASNIEWNSIFRSSGIDTRNKSNIENNLNLQLQNATAINLLRMLQESKTDASKIFDSEKLGKYLALVRIWGAEHGLDFDDINFYFNPITCLLEPIGFDAVPGGLDTTYCYFSWGMYKDNWVNYALTDINISYSYIHNLNKFTSENYLTETEKELGGRELNIRNNLLKDLFMTTKANVQNNFTSLIDYDPWKLVKSKSSSIKKELGYNEIVECFAKPLINQNFIEVVVKNVTTQPVELIKLECDSKHFNATDYLINPNGNSNSDLKLIETLIIPGQGNGWRQTETDHVFHLPFPRHQEILSGKIPNLFVHVRFWGNSSKTLKLPVKISPFTFQPELLPGSSISDPSISFPSFIERSRSSYSIKKGSHVINKNLHIPFAHNLIIESGAELMFDTNVTVMVSGGVSIRGTEEHPVVLRALHRHWGGLLIMNAKQTSHITNTRFLGVRGVGKGPNPRGLVQNGWTMTGGITVYNSTVNFDSCYFEDFYSEDALNIVSSKFMLKNCNFSKILSDAFDGDFVKGEIINCNFSDISGDGVDFSGSFCEVRKCNFKNIADKAISVGEDSKVAIDACFVEKVSFGVVSKDLSKTTVSKSVIKSAKVAAFSAFQKKNLFGPAIIDISDTNISSCNKSFIVQDKSKAFFNNMIVPTTIFDSKVLY